MTTKERSTPQRRLSKKDRAVLRDAALALAQEAKVIFDSNKDCVTKRIEDATERARHERFIGLHKQLVAIARTARSQ